MEIGNINLKIAKVALDKLEIDELGLDDVDRRMLETMIEKFKGGPVRSRSNSNNNWRRNRYNRRCI